MDGSSAQPYPQLIVIFEEKWVFFVYKHTWYPFYNFLTPNYSIATWFSAKVCCFSVFPKDSANMLAEILPTWHVVLLALSNWQNLLMCEPEIFGIFLMFPHAGSQDDIWGGGTDTTGCQHFHLGLISQSLWIIWN